MRNLTGSSTWDMLHQGCFVPMFLDQSTPLPIVLVRIPKLSSYFFEPETTSLPNARFITSAFIPLDASEIHWKQQHMSTRIQWKKKRRYRKNFLHPNPMIYRKTGKPGNFSISDLISGPWLQYLLLQKKSPNPSAASPPWGHHLVASIPPAVLDTWSGLGEASGGLLDEKSMPTANLAIFGYFRSWKLDLA